MNEKQKGISFWKAWLLPGVIPVSICYLGLKLANYSIMLWLPKYAVVELHFEPAQKALIASLYDAGTIAGCILLGYLSDLFYGKRIIVSFFGLLLAALGHVFLIYTKDTTLLYFLIFFLGFLVGGISGIICAPVCADIAKRSNLENES